MKRDYVVVSADDASADESLFIERFWTRQWEGKAELRKLELITRGYKYRLVKPFLDTLPPGGRILDGGCGLGMWTVFLTNRGAAVTGLDISQATIGRLKELLRGYDFVCGDIRQTGFPDASFDAYVSWGTFEHFESGLGECIVEAWRVLKPGGLLIITVPFQNMWHILRDLRAPRRWDRTYDPRLGYRRRQRFYQWHLTRPELQRELELRGFRVLQITPLNKKEGVTHWLEARPRLFRKGTVLFSAARRLLSATLPASYIAHMILAVARKVEAPR
jgi:SAM-dependent methyltransferase